MHSLLQSGKRLSWPTRNGITPALKAMRLSLLVAFLSSCANSPVDRTDVLIRDVEIKAEPVESETANPLDDGGSLSSVPLDAENSRESERAAYYEQLATAEQDNKQRVDASLSSAEYYVQAGQHQRAAEIINAISDSITEPTQADRAIIVLAYADYSEARYETALARLSPILGSIANAPIASRNYADSRGGQASSDYGDENQAGVDDGSDVIRQRQYITEPDEVTQAEPLTTQQVDALLLSSFCYQSMGDYDKAVDALITREKGLFGAARAETTRYIWQVINTIPADQRQIIAEQSESAQVRNRLQQSLNGQMAMVEQSPSQFNQWRDALPNEEAKSVIAGQWTAASPRSIYVLLPFSSRYGKAANAVKAGIELQHQANESAFRPFISYYDIGDNPLQIGQYYAAAVRAGADFVIGPIGVTYGNEANQSAGYFSTNRDGNGRQQAPMLMLGGDQPLNSGNYRLAISPELDGVLVAERAWQDGHLSAAILTSNNNRSQRALNGFKNRWLSLGGKISKTIEYSDQQYDHSVELKQLFDINQSEYRFRQLSQTLRAKPKFNPYQRADIDFVFMLANDKTGRIVRPQINFFTNSQLPVYSTSFLYNGIADPINNMDLDQTVFPVMPWVVRSNNVSQWAGQLNMLHAMGMDAYKIAGNFGALRSSGYAITGATGQLQLAANGEVLYSPAWAKFENGEVVVIDDNNLDLTPILGNDEAGTESNVYRHDTNQSKGSYNDQNWDPRKSRRKTGG